MWKPQGNVVISHFMLRIYLTDFIALTFISNGFSNFLIRLKTVIKSNDFEVKNIKSLLNNTRTLNTFLAWIAGGSEGAEYPQGLSNYILFYVPLHKEQY